MRRFEIDSLAALRNLRVHDVMSHSPRSIDHRCRVSEAMDLMERLDIRHLPVVRDAKLVGLVTERGVRDAMPSMLMLRDPVARRKSLDALHVHEIWIEAPTTIESKATLIGAIRTMRRLRAGSLPVVDDGALVGIVTSGDLISALESLLQTEGA